MCDTSGCVAAGRTAMGIRLGVILAIGGGLFKSFQQNGVKLLPVVEHKEQGMFHQYHRYFGPGRIEEAKLPPTYT